MLERPSRRTALKQIAAAGVAATITPITIRGQSAPIRVAGMPVEIAIASVSPVTVRAGRHVARLLDRGPGRRRP